MTNKMTMVNANALDLIDAAIAKLEARLNLPPGGCLSKCSDEEDTMKKQPKETTSAASIPAKEKKAKKDDSKANQSSKVKADNNNNNSSTGNQTSSTPSSNEIPDICKLEFKVGQIVKVWVHPEADKLYCEEIECGEEKPRQIASGLRMHYSEDQMLGQRLLVVANLKPKKLVGFQSHGMVLCAAETKDDGSEKVEFIEPPADAPLGEIITFDQLPAPEPLSPAQVEKKKIFQACMDGMKTTQDCLASWNGHVFMTSAGPCRSKTIQGGVMR